MAWFRTDPQEVLKETVLWTNPDPTSAMVDDTTINLSDGISNYEYVKIKFNYSTTNTTSTTEVIYSSDEFQKYTGTTVQTFFACVGYKGSVTLNNYVRYFNYVSDTQLKTSSNKIGGSEGVASYAIPTQVIGIKRGIEVNLPFYETELWTNSSPTSSFAGGTIVDLSDDMNNYDFLKFEYRHSTSVATLYNIVVPVNLFKTTVQGDTSSTNQYIVTLSAWVSGSFSFGQFIRRLAIRKTDTSVYFTGGGNMGSTAANNANIIPTRIIGVKQGAN